MCSLFSFFLPAGSSSPDRRVSQDRGRSSFVARPAVSCASSPWPFELCSAAQRFVYAVPPTKEEGVDKIDGPMVVCGIPKLPGTALIVRRLWRTREEQRKRLYSEKRE